MHIQDAFNITSLGFDEAEERRRDAQDQKDAQREERIKETTKEHIEDVGTFFEFIQSIQISGDDEPFFEGLHKDILSGDAINITDRMSDLYMSYCQEKAEEIE